MWLIPLAEETQGVRVKLCYVLTFACYMTYLLTYFKPSAISQPTWPTQPSIPQGSVNE